MTIDAPADPFEVAPTELPPRDTEADTAAPAGTLSEFCRRRGYLRPERPSSEASGTFVDISASLSSLPVLAHAVALTDLDDDGFPEVIACGRKDLQHNGMDLGGTAKIFANCGGTFVEAIDLREALPGPATDDCFTLDVVDIDGDGSEDLFIGTANGAGLYMYRGLPPDEDDGTFRFDAERVLRPPSGIRAEQITSLAFADFDRNGRLDIYVGVSWPSSYSYQPDQPTGADHILFQTPAGFADGGGGEPLRTAGQSNTLAAGVLELWDGPPLLYLAIDWTWDHLFQVGGAVPFEEVPFSHERFFYSMGVDHWCQSNRCEVAVTDYVQWNLLEVDGTGLVDVSAERRDETDPGRIFWGARFADLANNDRPQLVLTAGRASLLQPELVLPVLHAGGLMRMIHDPATDRWSYANAGLGRWFDGRELPDWSGVRVADVDGDGRLDVLAVPYPRTPIFHPSKTGPIHAPAVYGEADDVMDIAAPLVLLRNELASGRWLEVQLDHPIGTRVQVTCGGLAQVDHVEVDGAHLGSTEAYRVVHFGLGACEEPVALTVRPPGGLDSSHTVASNQRVILRREADAPVAWHPW